MQQLHRQNPWVCHSHAQRSQLDYTQFKKVQPAPRHAKKKPTHLSRQWRLQMTVVPGEPADSTNRMQCRVYANTWLEHATYSCNRLLITGVQSCPDCPTHPCTMACHSFNFKQFVLTFSRGCLSHAPLLDKEHSSHCREGEGTIR